MRISETSRLALMAFTACGVSAAVAVADVRLLVGDTGPQNTLRLFDRFTGDALGEFTQGGVPGGPFGFEFGPDGNLYVAGFNANAVYRFTAAGQPMGTFVSPGSGGLSSPYDLEFGPDGNLYASDFDNSRILRYDGSTGAAMGEFVSAGSGGLDHPHTLRFRDGYLYVSHQGNSILRYDGATGAFVDEFVSQGSGGLTTPLGFTWGPDGLLYVASQDTYEILRYNGQTGAFVNQFADLTDPWLGAPRWLAFDAGPDPDLYVSTSSGVVRYDWATGHPVGHLLYESELPDARYVMLAEIPGQDCNYNGVLDQRDIAAGTSLDCNSNSVPDECEVGEVIPREYALDDGEKNVSLGLTPPGTLAWLNQFAVGSNRETVAAIELSYGPVPNGTPVTVCLWSDPDGDGNPTDAVVLASAATVVANANTDVYNTTDIPDVYVGPPGTSFFVGAIIIHPEGAAPASLDQTTTHERSWVAGDITLDPNNLGAAALFGRIDAFGRPGNWTIRAVPTQSATLNDCNSNGIPDDCDIATGTSTDLNGNGVPDECESTGDLNCDGAIDNFDINPFVLALTDPTGYQARYPNCSRMNADCNSDGVVDNFDINPFVALLTQP